MRSRGAVPSTYAGTAWPGAASKRPLWDLEARLAGVPLWQHIGGGAHGNPLRRVHRHSGYRAATCSRRSRRELAAGYQRIKIKIKPGWDVDVLRDVRRAFPEHSADGRRQLRLHAGRYRAPAQRLDEFGLMMIEQPLAHDDILDHATLQAQLGDAHLPGRMHPHGAPRRTGDRLRRLPHHQHQAGPRRRLRARRARSTMSRRPHGIPVWCGGMLESGIGRAHNIALVDARRTSRCRATSRPASAIGARDMIAAAG